MTHESLTAIGASMRAKRKHFNLTQQQLADLVGLSDKTIRDMENATGTTGIGAVIFTLDALGLELEVIGE